MLFDVTEASEVSQNDMMQWKIESQMRGKITDCELLQNAVVQLWWWIIGIVVKPQMN